MPIDVRKTMKDIYYPKSSPVEVDIPKARYFVIEGEGSEESAAYDQALRSIELTSNAVKEYSKKNPVPKEWKDFYVAPVEITWNQDKTKFELAVMQPDFLSSEVYAKIKNITNARNADVALDDIALVDREGKHCLTMLHISTRETLDESFKLMDVYCEKKGFSKKEGYCEILANDPKKPAKAPKIIIRYDI